MSAPSEKWSLIGDGTLALWDEAETLILGWIYASPPDQAEKWALGCMKCEWFDLRYGEGAAKLTVERHVVTHVEAVVS